MTQDGAALQRHNDAPETPESGCATIRRSTPTPWLWGITLFASALLLFAVQPMVARMLLPQLGGTPTVWNTCMVFFQLILLAGYAYSHFLTSRLSLKVQWLVHGGVVVAALLALPIALPERTAVPSQAHPVAWLLGNLLLMVGLPFFVVSTTGPLVQNWFSRTTHPSARDPYFLYGASNLGSLIALLGYPVLLEPFFALKHQSALWAGAYMAFALLVAACAIKARSAPPSSQTVPGVVPFPVAPIARTRRLLWVVLAFVPSSLMLGVTTYLTTDIASAPLLWVVPLALYLLSFIMAFARQKPRLLPVAGKTLPIAVVALVFLMLTDTRNPAWLLMGLHLLFFFLAALLCHSRLAAQRPPAQHLTEFYLWLSVGGALGGTFNALLAPVLFSTVVEYPLMIAVAASVAASEKTRWLDWILPATVGIITASLAHWVPRVGETAPQWTVLVVFGLPLIFCYFLSKRPLRFALGVGAVMLGAQCYTAVHGKVLHAERNFFGALRVTLDPSGQMRRFYHGTTVHGCQFLDPMRRGEPHAYYDRTGPFGVAFDALAPRKENSRIAAIGLGAGVIAAYTRFGQHWTFYEIDPAVIRIARDTNFFHYLADAKATLDYKVGDARLTLRDAPPGSFGLLVCDAFSSDVPPLHLMTREAMEMYFSKLAPDGAMLFHISSRYLDFGPVLAGLANGLGLHAREWNEAAVPAEAMANGKYPSRWVVLARSPAALGNLASDRRWTPLQPRPGMRVWTDDFSNLLSIFDWR